MMKFSKITLVWIDSSDDETIEVKTKELATNLYWAMLPYGCTNIIYQVEDKSAYREEQQNSEHA